MISATGLRHALALTAHGRIVEMLELEETGEVRAYRVDRIQGVRVTTESFVPRYAIELSVALPVRTGCRAPRPGARRRRRGH